ncbi:hypothetical protein [Oricola nitratireducens]|jgi:hypothetical protein|uniref:hypothetical protein n=1 Tax=Oricola nitratireducens TaxID=2775868 RepID=UPI0018664F3D|nr:hypothetical protein [Oricola nitratireducens]
MPRLSFSRVLAVLFVLTASPAAACEFLTDAGNGPEAVQFADIQPGIAPGALRCGSDLFPGYLWTLGVDGQQAELGIRDDKLFDAESTGPLVELLSAKVEGHARVTVHERRETAAMPRSPLPQGWFQYRRFVTFCDATGYDDPLDCSLGRARVKARATAADSDRDGYLDMSTHEISFYDGASKLHVLNFVTPWTESLTADIATWIEAINAVSDALKPKKFASAD